MEITPDTGRVEYAREQIRFERNVGEMQSLDPEQGKLKEACEGFEAIFTKQLLDSMRNNIPESGLLPKTPARELYEDMLYDTYAKEIAKSGDLGLGDMLYRQMSRILEGEKIADGWRSESASAYR